MNVLDILLLVAAVWFAIVGYRQGFVVGILSVIGFLGGGLVAVYTLPVIWDALTEKAEVEHDRRRRRGRRRHRLRLRRPGPHHPPRQQAAPVHHLVPGPRPGRDRRRPGQRRRDAPGRLADRLRPRRHHAADARQGGPQLQGAARRLAGAAGRRPTPGSRTSPRSSRRTASRRSSARSRTSRSTTSSRPTRRSPTAPVATSAQRSIVKVMGTAQSCGKVLEGSGFVFGDRRVMTNAHVVGGVDEPTVQIGGEGRKYDATVVLYDWQRDIAVLDVPDLKAPVPEVHHHGRQRAATARSSPASRRTASYDVRAARVRGRITANGPDIYHRGTVRRDVYSLYATVRQGNSGGPLLTPEGQGVRRGLREVPRRRRHRVRAHRGRDPGGHHRGAYREPAGGQRQLRALRLRVERARG